MASITRGKGPRGRAIGMAAIAALLAAAMAPAAASATKASPLTPFLLKTGEETGFKAGAQHSFSSAKAVAKYFKEKGKEATTELERFEGEGFVASATESMHDETEKGEGLSSVMEFKTHAGAKSEMKFELKQDLNPKATPKGTTVKHFKISGVPGVVAFSFTEKKTGEAAANALFVENQCFFVIGDFKQSGKEITAPVAAGAKALYKRTEGKCP